MKSLPSTLVANAEAGLNNNAFWLTGLRYLEEKKAILAEFSRGTLRRTARFAFFPSILVSKKAISEEELKKEISETGVQKFRMQEMENCFIVTSTNFSSLETLANNIFESYKAIAIMPPAERQFLIEKNWDFFDSFEFEEEPERKSKFSIPDAKLEFFSEPLETTIKQLSKIDRKESESVLSLLALSKILKIPLEKIPSAGFLRQEIFLENIFFKNRFVPEKISKSYAKESHSTQAAGFLRGTAELDIAPFLPTLLTSAFFNSSFETIDCECCEPKGIEERNLLDNSLAETEFLKDAFYFETGNSAYSEKFHESHSFKENRARRKKEFFLKNFPIGPFSRNHTEKIPLQDALGLEKTGDAKIISFSEKHWFCTKKEGFISKIISAVNKEILETEKFSEEKQKQCFENKSIIECLEAENDIEIGLAMQYKKNLEFFLHNLPAQLADRESRFFDEKLSNTIESIRSNAVSSFKLFETKKEAVQSREFALAQIRQAK